jgi:hypothetical protein
MKKLRFLNAYERYKVAQSAASDRPDPYFRLGFSLAAVSNFDSAIKYIKQGLDLDPEWPVHGDKLDALFGEDNRLSVLTLIERIGGWVHEDIRDPDRLFLMGVVLHFDGDTRASEFFEAAYRLAGSGDHLLAFLHPSGAPGANAPTMTGPGVPYGQGMAGGIPAPQPQEPQEGPPQMVAPPNFAPGQQQGMFSPPNPGPPRGLYERPQGPRQAMPRNSQPMNPSPAMPQQGSPPPGLPTLAKPPQGPPQQATPPQKPQPTLPPLPVPPLPAPEEPGEGPQTSNPSAPLNGPALGPPISGSTDGSTTAQSP